MGRDEDTVLCCACCAVLCCAVRCVGVEMRVVVEAFRAWGSCPVCEAASVSVHPPDSVPGN